MQVRRVWRAAVLLLALGAAPALADRPDHHCDVPLADWQPREALQKKLEAMGWTVISIRSHDGCYKVRALDENGERVERRFDPSTLEPARRWHHEEDD